MHFQNKKEHYLQKNTAQVSDSSLPLDFEGMSLGVIHPLVLAVGAHLPVRICSNYQVSHVSWQG